MPLSTRTCATTKAGSPMPGAMAASARRACSTTMPAWRAPRWRCSRRLARLPISADAIERAAVAQELFGDADGSFFITAHDAADVPGARPRHPHDGATPSGVGLMAEVLARLHHLTGRQRWRDAAERLIRAFTGAPDMLPQSPLLLAAADFLERGIVVVVVGATDDPAALALVQCGLSSPDPATCVLRAIDGADRPNDSPAWGKTLVNRAPAAYVCRGQTCTLPVATPRQLRSLMKAGASPAVD